MDNSPFPPVARTLFGLYRRYDMSTGGSDNGASRLVTTLLTGVLAVAIVSNFAPAAQAFDLDEFRARMEQRKAELRSRLENMQDGSGSTDTTEEIPAPDGPAGDTTTNNTEGTPALESSCSCSASLSYSRADIRWQGNTLVFVPIFNVTIRVRGEGNQNDQWNLGLNYNGNAAFTSEDYTPPASTNFSGNHQWGGSCTNTRLNFSGFQEPAVPIASLVRNSLTDGTIDGVIQLRSSLSGCDTDSEAKQARFTIKEFGNVSVRLWNSIR